jgi:YD repeat-containing protein
VTNPPPVTNHLDRLGRPTNILDGAGSHFVRYNSAGLVLTETNASGVLAGLSLSNGYDAFLRRTSLTVRSNNAILFTHSFGYDPASRMTNVSDGVYSGGYTYLANSPLISQIAFRSNSTSRMTTTKQHDFLNRLQSISSQPAASGSSPISYAYAYNDVNQRVSRTEADGSSWLYEYDKLGQLTSAEKIGVASKDLIWPNSWGFFSRGRWPEIGSPSHLSYHAG